MCTGEAADTRMDGAQRFVAFKERPTASDLSDELFDVINANKRQHMNWKGVPMLKSPFDAWILVEMLREIRPRTVIELGAFAGGSALFLADQLLALGVEEATVLSVDNNIDRLDRTALAAQLTHRLVFIPGDVRDLASIFTPDLLTTLHRPMLVLEDAHVDVPGVMAFFDGVLDVGDYIVIEDTVDDSKMAAVTQALGGPMGEAFAVDAKLCDMFGRNVCWAPNAYLRKMAPPRASGYPQR